MALDALFEDKMVVPLKSIRQCLDWTEQTLCAADIYYGHGTDNAWDEAVALVLAATELPFNVEVSQLEAAIVAESKAKLLSWVKQRVLERTPTPYLTQQAWFAGYPFYVDERVIIPRSPLAEWIARGFSPWLAPQQVRSVLDLCTGSACIACACAWAFPQSRVDAIDISKPALEVARKNVDQYQLQERVRLIESDLMAALTKHDHYDLIISNPPYVGVEECNALPDEYHHEPRIALESGADGMNAVHSILKQAQNHLNPGGILVVEVGNTQDLVRQQYPTLDMIWLDFEQGGDGVFLLQAPWTVT
jgi:ribosomal protein L3 glutamine methyltransferase